MSERKRGDSHMKIQIASDLHLENWQLNMPNPIGQFEPDPTRDLLILAGDITDGNRRWGLPFIRSELDVSPVIFVPGNHEYYHKAKPEVDAFWRTFARTHEGFHYLNDDTVELGGLSFYGAEWCSDFWGDPLYFHFERSIADFWRTQDWNSSKHVAEFRAVTDSMKGLARPVDVVITHFPPTLGAIDQALYRNNPLNPYFINDCEWLVRHLAPKLWVSGHTHSPFDYQVGGTRIVINPCGYFRETQAPLPGFSAMKTVTVSP